MSFLNVLAADEALPRIVQIMAEELKWDKNKQQVFKINFIKQNIQIWHDL